jgi:GTP cyclohydrolase IA
VDSQREPLTTHGWALGEEPATSTELIDLFRQVIGLLGEDPDRQGLLRTPQRVAESYAFLTRGYGLDPYVVVGDAVFDEAYNEMVIVRDIELYSLCEHHLLPFYGRCHVGYVPKGKIIGLSKIPRLVDIFARRFQVQERLTTEIANALCDIVDPRGAAVVIEAKHLCMMMRGVEKQNSAVVTNCLLGLFKSDPRTRAEFLSAISK